VNLTLEQYECHIGKKLSLQEFTQLIRIKLLIISRFPENPLCPPADAYATDPYFLASWLLQQQLLRRKVFSRFTRIKTEFKLAMFQERLPTLVLQLTASP